VSKAEAQRVAKRLGIIFKRGGITLPNFQRGMQVELEHGCKGGRMTNVTANNLVSTGRIALAHLQESPAYYGFLKRMETKMERSEKKKRKSKKV
jgi:hypothetical protein